MNTFRKFTLSILLLFCITYQISALHLTPTLAVINPENQDLNHRTFSETFNWWNYLVEYDDTPTDAPDLLTIDADFMIMDCPEQINGFTNLGSYNNHQYYLSNNTSTWEAASVIAAGNDGYLVSFENAAENEFVRSQLGGVIAFIGYNDAGTEGNFQWDSNESVGYTNADGSNTSSKDYANMNFWNGEWSFDGQYTARRFVMEIACGSEPEPPSTCNVTWTTTSNSITVNGLNTPHVIMKLFNPNYSIFYDCFDNCPDPLTLSGLTNGATYHLSYDLFDANWQKICGDVVDVVITGNNPNRPNLNTSNLVVPATATEGSVMDFTFNLNNNGNAIASGNYIINIYANNGSNSTLVGEVSTGNTPIGTIANVPGAVDLSGLAPGNYTLLVRTDDTNQILESNESDNDSSASFTIEPRNPTDACGFLNIDIVTTTNTRLGSCSAEEFSDKYSFSINGGGSFGEDPIILELDIDKNGDLLSFSESPAPEVDPQDFLDIELNDQDIEVSLIAGGTNTPIWTRTVTLNPGGNFEIIGSAVSNGSTVYDGFFVAGTIVVQDPAVGENVFLQYTIKLDENGTVEHANILDNIPNFDFFFRLSSSYTTSGGYVFDMFQSNLLSFIKFSETGEFLWRYAFASDLPSNSLREIELSEDEQFIYAVNRNNQRAFIDKVNTVTGELVYKLPVDTQLGGNFSQNIEGIYLTDDGGLITGITSNDFGPVGEVFNYGKLDANGNAVWTNEFPGTIDFDPLLQTSDGGFLWLAKVGNFTETDFSVLKITSEGLLTPSCDGEGNGIDIGCDLSYTTSGGNLSITGSGLDAGHVIIKVFSPNWQTIFSCFDDCGSSIDLSGLSPGTYHINVDLYNSSWQKTCDLMEDIPVGNSSLLVSERIEMLYFNATKNGLGANLNWVTNNSFKTDYFVLERSTDGQNFESIGQVPSLGESDQALAYQSKDTAPLVGTNFYRITQVFLDGSSSESMIKPLNFKTDLDAIMVYPNPAADEFYLSLKPYTGHAATISIVNALGEVVQHIQLDQVLDTPIRFDASDLHSSLYHVMVQIEGKKMITKKVVVARR